MPVLNDFQRSMMVNNSLKTRRRNKVKKLILTAIQLCTENGDSPKKVFESILEEEVIEMPEWLETAADILKT